MKKLLIICALVAMGVIPSFSQTTTNSTNPNQTRTDANNKKNAAGEKQSINEAAGEKGQKKSQVATGTGAGKATANASAKTDAGKKAGSSTENVSKSAVDPAAARRAQAAATVSQGAINNTKPDTTLKKGSGSSARNQKNRTGKTGNYKNEATKNIEKK